MNYGQTALAFGLGAGTGALLGAGFGSIGAIAPMPKGLMGGNLTSLVLGNLLGLKE